MTKMCARNWLIYHPNMGYCQKVHPREADEYFHPHGCCCYNLGHNSDNASTQSFALHSFWILYWLVCKSLDLQISAPGFWSPRRQGTVIESYIPPEYPATKTTSHTAGRIPAQVSVVCFMGGSWLNRHPSGCFFQVSCWSSALRLIPKSICGCQKTPAPSEGFSGGNVQCDDHKKGFDPSPISWVYR